jgi:hypothetical protein
MHPTQGARFNDGEAIVQAALLGLGLAQVPDNIAADELAAGRLAEVLPQYRPPAMPIHAVMPAIRLVPARVRVPLDEWDAATRASPGKALRSGSAPPRPRRLKTPARADEPPARCPGSAGVRGRDDPGRAVQLHLTVRRGERLERSLDRNENLRAVLLADLGHEA